ncbi:MAG: metalloprotease TldD [Nitrospirae bacterium]|nr:metalloprotease TldD [Nitrospirota bacterium]
MHPETFFLEKFGILPRLLEKTLGDLLGGEIDDGDLYFEYRTSEGLSLEEGLVKTASKHVSQGVGVRALAGEKTGYAYSDALTEENLGLAAKTARSIAPNGGGFTAPARLREGPASPPRNLYPIDLPAMEIPVQAKVRLLEKIDRIAREYDPRVKNVLASFSSEHKIILIATADGVVGDIQPLCRLNVTCIAEGPSGRQSGTYGGGGRSSFAYFFDENRYAHFAREAARQAIVNLEAAKAPAGMMDVVLGPGWPGILLHEAVGHGLEADFNRKRTSAFTDLIGKRVASETCTVVDDGTIPCRRGSLNVDDEGTPTQRTVLIEKGILRGYLQDRLNAKLLRMPLTGNGRRESYAHPPMPRMTNTFLLPGQIPPDEIIRSVQKGLYATAFGGGQVDITSGKFVFSASEAYLIENGKVTRPVRGATLIGNGPDVLTRVSMVGNDLELDAGIGTCGKDGQSVPVGVGLPTLRIDGITVGGTE